MQLLFSFTVGGAEKLVVDLSNQLIKRGHEVHVYGKGSWGQGCIPGR